MIVFVHSIFQGFDMLFIDIVLPVFIIIFAGYLFEKAAKPDFRTLTNSALYLFAPSLVFAALMKRDIPFELGTSIFFFMLLYTTVFMLLSIITGRLLSMDRETRGALSLTTVMMNVGNFGLPLAYFAFGDAGLEASILTFVFFNIPLGTLAIVIAQGPRFNLKESILNTARIPIFHAVLAAMILKFFHVEVPSFLLKPIDLVGQAAIPLMLILLGMQLAKTDVIPNLRFLSTATLLRLVAAPVVAYALASLLGITALDRDVVVLQTSTPSAILPLLYSIRFQTRPDLVASTIFVTTLLSSVSLTILLALMH